jgi:hypothetical protein
MTNTGRKPKVRPESVRDWPCGSTADCRLLLQLCLYIPLAAFVRSSPLGAVGDGVTPRAAPSAETANDTAAKRVDKTNDMVIDTSAVEFAMPRLVADGVSSRVNN